MAITSKELTHYLYEMKLPQVYRDKDSELGYPLRRYLEALIELGSEGVVDDINGFDLLLDIFLPYLCASFGLEFFKDIDKSYQRKFITNIGEIIQRRGTFSCIHFIIRVLTGLNAELSMQDTILKVALLARDLEEINNIDVSMAVVERHLKGHLPFYINPIFDSKIDTQVIKSKSYSHSVVGSYKFYTINKYKEVN